MTPMFPRTGFDVAIQNPFLAAPEKSEPARAVEQSYVLVAQGPKVADEEVETLASAVEVQVLWGSTVLAITHLEEGRSFSVGSGPDADFVLAEETLGRPVLPIVAARGGVASIVVPEDASVRIGGSSSISVSDLAASGRARPSAEGAGVFELPVAEGQSVRVNLAGSDVAYIVRGVRAGKAVPAGFLASLSSAAHKYIGLSLLGHLGVIASLAYFMPSMGPDDAEGASRDNLLFMQKMLNAQAPRELQAEPEAGGGEKHDTEGGQGERAQSAEGSMGKTTATASNARWAFKGSAANPQVQLKSEREQAAEFGMVALLSGDPKAPSAPWGTLGAEGADDRSAMGNMWGVSIGDALGMGGFGLSGTGEGGGGLGEGIGLGKVGTLGHGDGTGDGLGFGPGKGGLGTGHGPGSGGHVAKAPNPMREGIIESNGRIPRETIQRVVRANFGRFRACYESGLRNNPGLTGRVVTKFVIGRDGAVGVSQDGGSDMPDRGVVNCIVRSYQNLSFPSPEGGVVTVVYPLMFSPGE